MKRFAVISLAILASLALSGAVWWHELNVLPAVSIPKPPPLPSPNAYDYFMAASKLAWYGDGDAVDGASKVSPAEEKVVLGKNQPVVVEARKGFAYPYVNPLTEKIPGMKERDVGDVFGFAGKVYAEEGDRNNALRCDLDAVQVGTMVEQGGSTWCLFHGETCEGLGIRRMWPMVDHLNGAQTKAAIARLQTILAGSISYDQALELSKRLDQIGLLQLFRERNWRGRPIVSKYVYIAKPPTLYLSSDRAIFANEVSFDDAWIHEVRKPYAAKLPLPAVPTDAWHQWQNSDTSPYFNGGPSYGGQLNRSRVEEWFRYVAIQTQGNLMLVSLALHAYKLGHGAYPSSLDQLAPAYLKSIPADPFALSGSFKYKRVSDKYVLYSVGPDGKDDGGKPIDQVLVIGGIAYPPASHNIIDMNSKGDIVAGVNL